MTVVPCVALEVTWPTQCIHGLPVDGPWCAKCRSIGLGLTDHEVADVAWAILLALHENVPEDKRPMSWSDVNGDQEQRIRSAAVAAIEYIRGRDTSGDCAPAAARTIAMIVAHEWIEVGARRWCLACGSYQVRRNGLWRDEMVGPYPAYNRTDVSAHRGQA